MDLSELPIEILQKILSSLTTNSEQPNLGTTLSRSQFVDTKEVLRTSVLSKAFLQASSTLPDLNLSCKVSNFSCDALDIDESAEEALVVKHRFVNYVNHILTRYQTHNISLRTLRLDVWVDDVNFANTLCQLIRKADECGVVKEIYLNLSIGNFISNFVNSVFSLRKLVSLSLYGGDLVYNSEILINCSSLRTLELNSVAIDQCMLDKLFHSCPLIEGFQLSYCRIEVIKLANLPNLKWLKVFTYKYKRQTIDVNVPSLEHMIYNRTPSQSYQSFSIESTQNLKVLCLHQSTITDEQFHNLTANCPILKKLILDDCYVLGNIDVSSHSVSSLSLNYCDNLTEVNFDAPILTEFEFVGRCFLPSLTFTSRDSLKRKSSVTLILDYLTQEQEFLELSEFLKLFKSSDNISLNILHYREISFDKDTFNSFRENNKAIPEFEQVCIEVTSRVLSPAYSYSSLMEGLLASFSPKILLVKKGVDEDFVTYRCKELKQDEDEDFVKYLCKELLLVEDEDYNPGSSTHPSQSWRSDFKQVKVKGIKEWRPLHSWKSMEDVMNNVGNQYFVKLIHK